MSAADDRLLQLENAFDTLNELVRKHQERVSPYTPAWHAALRAAQAKTDSKLAALAIVQRRPADLQARLLEEGRQRALFDDIDFPERDGDD